MVDLGADFLVVPMASYWGRLGGVDGVDASDDVWILAVGEVRPSQSLEA